VGTLANFLDRATRLYEQERRRPKFPSPLGAYVKRWWAWASGGLAELAPGIMTLPGDLVMRGSRAISPGV
jgi:hypothetical protein